MAFLAGAAGRSAGCASAPPAVRPTSSALSTGAQARRYSICRCQSLSERVRSPVPLSRPRRKTRLSVARDNEVATANKEQVQDTKDAAGAGDEIPAISVDLDDPRTAILSANKSQAVSIEESGRPLSEYMALPASQYSVLDAERVERLDEDTFRCFIGGISLLGFAVEPVITVSVTVQDRGCVVRLLSCQLQGNRIVEAANSRFHASMVNELSWRAESDDPDKKEIVSDLTLEVALSVPNWFRIVSPAAVSATGSKVMQQVVNQMVPRFLEQLKLDYARWASGDETRKPLGDGFGFDQ
eukprot:jgi/Tetstr1/457738/TSEL_044283.t1